MEHPPRLIEESGGDGAAGCDAGPIWVATATTLAPMTRKEAASACLAILDADFFRALCEPPRLDVLRRLIETGRADIATIAEPLPQDRSVVSRHLQVLERAGIVRSSREGRRVFYEMDGPAVLARFREILAFSERLVPLCCPGPAPGPGNPNQRRSEP